MKHKTHWKKMENPDYIGAYALTEGDDLTVTIESVKRETITGNGGKKEDCTVAYLKGLKPMILNRTNMKTISKIYGTPYVEDWAGKQITLYIAKIRAFGEDNVECLRIRQQQPQKPELTPNSEKWQQAVEALKTGNVTIEQIKSKYILTDKNEKELCK